MSGSVIKALLFDLGNVLINFDHWIAVKKLSPLSGKDPSAMHSLFFDSPLTQLFEEGKITPEKFFLRVKKELRVSVDYAAFVTIWSDIFFQTEENRLVYALAKRMRTRYKVGLISNINALHLKFLQQAIPVFDAFHFVVASCDVGAVKPKPKIYQVALKASGVLAQETFYVDDRAELVHAARALGMRAYVYKGFEQLEKDLAECGVA